MKIHASADVMRRLEAHHLPALTFLRGVVSQDNHTIRNNFEALPHEIRVKFSAFLENKRLNRSTFGYSDVAHLVRDEFDVLPKEIAERKIKYSKEMPGVIKLAEEIHDAVKDAGDDDLNRMIEKPTSSPKSTRGYMVVIRGIPKQIEEIKSSANKLALRSLVRNYLNSKINLESLQKQARERGFEVLSVDSAENKVRVRMKKRGATSTETWDSNDFIKKAAREYRGHQRDLLYLMRHYLNPNYMGSANHFEKIWRKTIQQRPT